jgi:hypothetical protein
MHFLVPLLAFAAVFENNLATVAAKSPQPRELIQRKKSCADDPLWAPTEDAYAKSKAESRLKKLLSKAKKSGDRLDKLLGNELGIDHFRCGIGQTSSCSVSSCFGRSMIMVYTRTY